MTGNTQRRNQTGIGAGRGSGHRARGRIMAVMLVGLGAAGGAITTIAVNAGAHGGVFRRLRTAGPRHLPRRKRRVSRDGEPPATSCAP